MKIRGLSLDGSKRRKTIVVAVALAVMAFAGPASAAPKATSAADNSVVWTSPTYSPASYSLQGRSWS